MVVTCTVTAEIPLSFPTFNREASKSVFITHLYLPLLILNEIIFAS